jgi:putative ABC transport system substrate-binding protein
MQRRELVTLLGGAALLWPVPARAQPRERMRRIGFLIGLAADDPEGQARITAFVQGLQQLGWTDGRNVRMEFRSGASAGAHYRKYAEELVALAPDVLVAGGTPAAGALREATRTLPVVFANIGDPVGLGYVTSLARPGANLTGFMNIEFSQSAKLLELLKQIAPGVTRTAVIRESTQNTGIGQFAAIQTVASSFKVELTPIDPRVEGELERAITAFVRGPSDGLIVTAQLRQKERALVIALSARHRLPTVYPWRRYVTEGGLISYGTDQAEPYRLAASYVDRILKGEKPADLPVQAPATYETVLNMKTAKALGLNVPAEVLVRAVEVIE